MIEYTIRDKETDQEVTGECHEILFVAGQEDGEDFNARTLYVGSNHYAEELADCLTKGALEEGSEPLRDILLNIFTQMKSDGYRRKFAKLLFQDVKKRMEKAGEEEDQDEDREEPAEGFAEFMAENGFTSSGAAAPPSPEGEGFGKE